MLANTYVSLSRLWRVCGWDRTGSSHAYIARATYLARYSYRQLLHAFRALARFIGKRPSSEWWIWAGWPFIYILLVVYHTSYVLSALGTCWFWHMTIYCFIQTKLIVHISSLRDSITAYASYTLIYPEKYCLLLHMHMLLLLLLFTLPLLFSFFFPFGEQCCSWWYIHIFPLVLTYYCFIKFSYLYWCHI